MIADACTHTHTLSLSLTDSLKTECLQWLIADRGIKSYTITEKIYYSVVVAGEESNHVLKDRQEAVTDDSIGQVIRRHLADR